MPELLLIRHCESTGQDPDAALTAAGCQQANALATLLNNESIDWIVASPFRRAQDTIRPLAERLGLDVQTDARLSERLLADPPVSDWRDFVRSSFSDPDARAPGGESGRETLLRGWSAVRCVADAGHRLPVLVSHGQLLALVLDSLQPGFGYEGWASLRNPDVFRLSGTHVDSLEVERWEPSSF